VQNVPNARSLPFIAELVAGGASRVEREFAELGQLESMSSLDGVRMLFASGEILHVRASGNAPELRCYVEADTEERARAILGYGMSKLTALSA
jgi:phosphomannomutase